MNLYIANLHFSIIENELEELFEPYGELGDISVILDKPSGKSKGYAFVEVKDNEQALKAIELLDGKLIRGRTITVKAAQEKTNIKI